MISATNACHSNKPSVLDDLHQGTCTLQMGTGEVPWIRLPTSHQFFHDLRFFGSLMEKQVSLNLKIFLK